MRLHVLYIEISTFGAVYRSAATKRHTDIVLPNLHTCISYCISGIDKELRACVLEGGCSHALPYLYRADLKKYLQYKASYDYTPRYRGWGVVIG